LVAANRVRRESSLGSSKLADTKDIRKTSSVCTANMDSIPVHRRAIAERGSLEYRQSTAHSRASRNPGDVAARPFAVSKCRCLRRSGRSPVLARRASRPPGASERRRAPVLSPPRPAVGQEVEAKNPATPKYRRGKIFQNGPGATRTRDLLLRSRPRPAATGDHQRAPPAGASQRRLVCYWERYWESPPIQDEPKALPRQTRGGTEKAVRSRQLSPQAQIERMVQGG
jgi:hypothetical protein